MKFPYITPYINRVFAAELNRRDYIYLRPPVIVFYFFYRILVFPIKFLIHRRPWGFESYLIDAILSFGTKYLASYEAAELFLRHVQIEPLIYRHLLAQSEYARERAGSPRKFNGVFGDFNLDNLKEIRWNNMTVGHDELSWEIGDHFDRAEFLANLETIRELKPEDHNLLSKKALEENRKHSFQILGVTNVVILVVFTITLLGDLRTTVRALNSFGSDSIVLWCMKMIYNGDNDVLSDLDFYLQSSSNRGHYHSSVFFSDPSQYLYYHIAFDEFVYDTLMNRTPAACSSVAAES